ncbi:hypothetical protein COO91_10547 (plasmid) [Nostoc flagelliforme CCNUN1]|uniref:Uncharacterized protein n=1 Tax=Nostoc flagelliforme CCNUN1 TaxID=2038116 RepID=A0A2K8T9F4_9NOSO|nr:hypothetical protein COO91_10547 [Nostoc flagelliforme CCNUN1]
MTDISDRADIPHSINFRLYKSRNNILPECQKIISQFA